MIMKVVLVSIATAMLAGGGTVAAVTRPLSPQEAVEKAALCAKIDPQVALALRKDLSRKTNPGVLHIRNGTEYSPTRMSCGTSRVIPRTDTPVAHDPMAIVDVAVHYADSSDVDHLYILAIEGGPGSDGSPSVLLVSATDYPFKSY